MSVPIECYKSPQPTASLVSMDPGWSLTLLSLPASQEDSNVGLLSAPPVPAFAGSK